MWRLILIQAESELTIRPRASLIPPHNRKPHESKGAAEDDRDGLRHGIPLGAAEREGGDDEEPRLLVEARAGAAPGAEIPDRPEAVDGRPDQAHSRGIEPPHGRPDRAPPAHVAPERLEPGRQCDPRAEDA